MTITQQGILMLISSAICGQTLTLPKDFDIEAALPLIQSHHMAPIVYDGALRCGISRQNPVMQKLFQSYCKGLMVSEAQLQQLNRVFAAFDEAGIAYMPLKGCNMKLRYPKPELRMMGDGDILIRQAQYEAIAAVLESLGLCYKSETDHEIIWQSKELYLELHKHLIPSYNKDFYAYFGDGWQLGKVKKGSRHSMTPEDEWVYLFTHFAKHYRDGGIGCRHVIDLWVFRRTYPQLDEVYVKEALEKLQLLAFYENICRLIDVWFGDAQGDEKTEYLTEYVFASGSWGKMESRTLSRVVRDAKHSPLGFSGRLVYLWKTIYPGVDALKGEYPVLRKAPWMLPLIWVVRPVRKILFQRKLLKNQGKKLEALSRDNIRQRQAMLNYVGLDYHF